LIRKVGSFLAVASCLSFPRPLPAANPGWIATSNSYTNQLVAIVMKHHPEVGSNEGFSEYDTKIAQPTLADEDQERHETEGVLAKLKEAVNQPHQPEVAQDLQIMIRKVELQFREQDFERAHDVPFYNASGAVYRGLRILLDEQTPNERRAAAVQRIRKYAGLEPGYKPLSEILRQRVMEQMAKPGVVYPARTELETELSRNSNYVDGIAALLTKYKVEGWQEPYEKLKGQLAEYDTWVKANVLPKSRTDFRLQPAEYALNLEDYGIDIPPARLAEMAHQMFNELQAEMKPIAEKIAAERHLPSSDYRDVIRELKKKQLVGEAILPFYEDRLKQIEKIIVDKQLVTLPDRPARIRIATAAETAQQPAPHMSPPPFMHNTGQKGEFILPLNLPAAPGQAASEKYDDFTFDAAAWTLTAHEARPGHAPAWAEKRGQRLAMDETHGKPQTEPDASKGDQRGKDADGRGEKVLDRAAARRQRCLPDDGQVSAAKYHHQSDRHPEQDDDRRPDCQARQVRLFGGRVAIALEGGWI